MRWGTCMAVRSKLISSEARPCNRSHFDTIVTAAKLKSSRSLITDSLLTSSSPRSTNHPVRIRAYSTKHLFHSNMEKGLLQLLSWFDAKKVCSNFYTFISSPSTKEKKKGKENLNFFCFSLSLSSSLITNQEPVRIVVCLFCFWSSS